MHMYTELMVKMYEIELPSGVDAKIENGTVTIKGKLGSTTKAVNMRLIRLSQESRKLRIEPTSNKKLGKSAELASQAFASELNQSVKGVQEGIERNMKVIYAHFPMSIEVKDKVLSIKNIFGEKTARTTEIVGDTKVEIKGQDVKIKGVDPYDVGQTIANIRAICHMRGYDTRVFQDGVYLVNEE